MKTFIIIISLALGTTFIHAQGFVILNSVAADITTNTAGYDLGQSGISGKISEGTGAYDFALLYATVTTAGDSSPLGPDWNVITLDGGGQLLGHNFAGIAGGLTGPGTSAGVQVDLASGTTYDVMLVGWSSNLGSSWPVVENQAADFDVSGAGFFGNTGIGTATPFSTAGPGDPTVFPAMFPNGSLTLYAIPIPEPTTLALAALGGLSMLLLGRCKFANGCSFLKMR